MADQRGSSRSGSLNVIMQNEGVPLILHYQALCGLSEQMLFAAQTHQWMSVVALGERYCAALDGLRHADRKVLLTSADRAQRHRLLLEILHNDARIRRLVDPGVARLDAILGAVDTRDDALRASSMAAVRL